MLNDNWAKLSPSDKLEARFDDWMSAPGIQFANDDVARAYQERAQLFKDAVQLKKPQRVPIHTHAGFYPVNYAGYTAQEVMNDYDKLGKAFKKFNADFRPDALASALYTGSAKIFEPLDLKLYRWAGHGVPANSPYQCVEAEYMLADEYDLLIADPTGYFIRYYLPRIFGALSPWQKLSPLTDLTELPFMGANLVAFGSPDVQQSFEELLEAGRAALEWMKAGGAINAASVASLGLAPLTAGFSKAPFDTLGDTLRGTRAIMLDKFRRPDKVLAACERLVPIAVEVGVRSSDTSRKPAVTVPLHKGADGFMSDADFKKFYWPTLKATILGMVHEGVVPFLFVEGSYNQRLDLIADSDIPKGTTVWMFDKSDMKEVKKKLGGWACFGGNVPVSMLAASKPDEVADYCKRLIDDVAQDGGFILSTGAVLDDATPENLHAMIETARTYGVYK
ncbi:MAG: uroporphyrinogen decarboxylase [Chloroflexi bacterium]|nr:uroporphyrinogen decarboxylase [Chloroflexota bacterium]